MPLDGHDSTPRQPPDRPLFTTTHIGEDSNKMLGKRIMMNPPEDFVQAALAASPVLPVNNAIVFDQGGQAVMVPPGALEEGDDDDTPAGQETEVPQSAASAPAQTQAQSQAQAPVQVPTTQAAVEPTPTPADSKSIVEMVTTQVTTATVTPTSAITSAFPTDTPTQTPTLTDTSQPTPSATSTMPNMRMSSSAPSSSSSSSVSASSTSSAAATSSAPATSEPSKPFTHSAPFIFLMVLGSLVIVAVAATLFSTFFRWKDSCGCLPCCRPDPDDDEDGLSDLVRSFDLERTSTAGLSRASSMRRPPRMMDARQVSLQNRSTLFANSPSQAGFLHTTSGVEGSIFESEDEKTTTDHLYGGHGQGGLEIKNAVEGDIPGENESLHGIGPRHLGVEGNGLEVPWRPAMPLRAYTGSEASYGEHHPQANVNYPDAPFPSPPVTINEQPTRASTWASNLRSTLFAAISTPAQPSQEDRYTRQVLPLHRNSTMKSTMSLTDNDSQFGRPYPLVINEADERELDASTSEVGKRFMMNREASGASAESRGTMTMTMGDRYKSWSRGGTAAWPKPVLAGGGRARGVSNQYV